MRLQQPLFTTRAQEQASPPPPLCRRAARRRGRRRCRRWRRAAAPWGRCSSAGRSTRWGCRRPWPPPPPSTSGCYCARTRASRTWGSRPRSTPRRWACRRSARREWAPRAPPLWCLRWKDFVVVAGSRGDDGLPCGILVFIVVTSVGKSIAIFVDLGTTVQVSYPIISITRLGISRHSICLLIECVGSLNKHFLRVLRRQCLTLLLPKIFSAKSNFPKNKNWMQNSKPFIP